MPTKDHDREDKKKKDGVVASYDWCWSCNAYHKNGEKECRPQDIEKRNVPYDQR